MTAEKFLSECESRLRKATPAPWYVDGTEVRHDFDPYSEETDCSVQICEVHRISDELDRKKDDREFIAHSRSDIERLIQIVREKNKDTERLEWIIKNRKTVEKTVEGFCVYPCAWDKFKPTPREAIDAAMQESRADEISGGRK